MIQAAKVAYIEQRRDLRKEVADQVEQRLIGAGLSDEKLLLLVSDKYTAHLKDEDVSRHQEVLSSHKSTHEKPPFLYTSNVELKSKLEPLTRAELWLNSGSNKFLVLRQVRLQH